MSLRMLLLVLAVATAIHFVIGRGIYIGSELEVRPAPEGRRYYMLCLYLHPGRVRRAIVGEGASPNEALKSHACSLIDRFDR